MAYKNFFIECTTLGLKFRTPRNDRKKITLHVFKKINRWIISCATREQNSKHSGEIQTYFLRSINLICYCELWYFKGTKVQIKIWASISCVRWIPLVYSTWIAVLKSAPNLHWVQQSTYVCNKPTIESVNNIVIKPLYTKYF